VRDLARQVLDEPLLDDLEVADAERPDRVEGTPEGVELREDRMDDRRGR
jgi:hypothetical protein